MLAGSTHDSKRSEDVRARLAALSEMPDAWRHALSRWSKLNRSKRRKLDSERAPSRNDEYLLYQTLLGIWPFEAADADGLAELAQRVEAYMTKAVREAKVNSSWINPNTDYEAATGDFVRALLAPEPNNLFLRDFVPFAQRVARIGALNSLGQLLLRLASPGVPDLYQGSELWDFSLVDPDNRRPVDYAQRQAALQAIRTACAERGEAACAGELLERLQDGQIKLYLTWKALALRRECEALFRDGGYLPLKTHGARAEQLCAFARHTAGETLVVLVPRLFGSLMGDDGHLPVGATVWGDTWVELPPERMHAQWDNVLTGQTVVMQALGEAHGLPLAQVFERFPYALLRTHPSPGHPENRS